MADAPTPRGRSGRAILLCLLVAGLLTAVDLASKAWAVDALSRPRGAAFAQVCSPDDQGYVPMQRVRTTAVVLVDEHLQLRYAENCGAAFGMLDDAPGWLRSSVFTFAALAAIGALGWMFVRGAGGRMFTLAVPLIMSGALGNLVDRVRYGYVIDFIRYHGLFEWPTFNVADAAITVGVVLLFFDGTSQPAGRAAASEVGPAPT